MGKLETRWDVIVIGSGLGGLTAATRMAKAGLRVLVLEQHEFAGGLASPREDPTREIGSCRGGAGA